MNPLDWSVPNDLLTPMFKRGSDFLGTRYPIICGAMTWVSEPKLVSAVCNNGCFGCIAGGNAPTDILAKQIEETRSLTQNNFGVNLITIAPSYKQHLEMLKDAYNRLLDEFSVSYNVDREEVGSYIQSKLMF